MKKLDHKAMKIYNMVIGFLRAGGNANAPFVRKFCNEFEISEEELYKLTTHELPSKNWYDNM